MQFVLAMRELKNKCSFGVLQQSLKQLNKKKDEKSNHSLTMFNYQKTINKYNTHGIITVL